MKLEINFSALWKHAREMGNYTSDFNIREQLLDEFSADTNLGTTQGIDIDITTLDTSSGLLSYAGQQVLLFIPDQGYAIQEVLRGNKEGRKFHVTDCSTLNKMKSNNRFNRYKVTNNLSGKFTVYGSDNYSGDMTGEAELKVCKCCLSYLNYKGYASGGRKNDIYTNFSIPEFLSEYSTLFSSTPERRNFIDAGGYSDDWRDISEKYRKSVGWYCESCQVNLRGDPKLLHTHHINGNKRDNIKENLKALCVDCHRKEYMHNHMIIKRCDMERIMFLRKQQGLLDISSWAEVIKKADKSLDGILRYYEKKGMPLPELNYELNFDSPEESITLHVAWPKLKKGIVYSELNARTVIPHGWRIQTIASVLKEINK